MSILNPSSKPSSKTSEAKTAKDSTTSTDSMITVWDPLVRIGHWVLVGGFLVAYLTQGEPEDLHTLAGYAVAAVVLIRLLWGFAGPKHARFADFVRGPGAALSYIQGLMRGSSPRFIGHTPAGGLMVVALLLSLGATAFTGMGMLAQEGEGPLAPMMGPAATAQIQVIAPAQADDDDDHEGREGHGGGEHGENPAAEQWEEVHELFANLSFILIGLHVLGVIASSTAHRENLVRSMIDGRKRP